MLPQEVWTLEAPQPDQSPVQRAETPLVPSVVQTLLLEGRRQEVLLQLELVLARLIPTRHLLPTP